MNKEQPDLRRCTGLVQKWLNNLCMRVMDPIVDFYHENAILVPTLSTEIRQGEIEIRDYFIDFLGDHPNLCGDIVFEVSQEIANSDYSDSNAMTVSGVYTFTWDGDVGKDESLVPESPLNTLTARFTFVFIWVFSEASYHEGNWKILTHHSSAMPKTTEFLKQAKQAIPAKQVNL